MSFVACDGPAEDIGNVSKVSLDKVDDKAFAVKEQDTKNILDASKLYLFTKRKSNTKKNVIYSSVDVRKWAEETADTPFIAHSGYQVVVFKDTIYFIGGYGGRTYRNDVWSSRDGKTWTKEISSDTFPARAYHQVAVFKGAMYVIGGISNTGPKNDVWSSRDGKTWVEETVNAEFSARRYHQGCSV